MVDDSNTTSTVTDNIPFIIFRTIIIELLAKTIRNSNKCGLVITLGKYRRDFNIHKYKKYLFI